MKHLKSRLFATGCILAGLSSSAWAASLPFGQAETGTIGSAGESASYTFSANASDVVDFTMVSTSGNLSPQIQLYNPTGQLIASASNRYPDGACAGGSTVELNTVTLAVAGTYTAIVSDCSATNTGNYTLYAQRTNNPSGAVTLPFGQTQTGTIGSAAQSNTYTFAANANDVLDFTMVTTNGNLSPKIRLYNPTGSLLSSASNNYPDGACAGGTTVEMNTVTLPATGAYTVLIGDCSDTNTGAYDIYVQRTNNPSGAVTLPFDETRTGTIATATQSNTYTFAANDGDVMDFTVVTTSGSLSPKIRLYNPSGTLLSSASNNYPDGACAGGSTIEMNTITLPSSGTYILLVGDCADTNAGGYDIYTQRTENPLGAANLPFGQTRTGTIGSAAQSFTYTFGANANDVVDFTMVTTSGSLSPKMRLYNSAGGLIASASNNYPDGACAGGSTVELNAVALPSSDTYTLLVGDCSDTNTGAYDLYAQRTNNPSSAPMLLLGQTQSGNVASAAQSASYRFSGSADDVFDFTMVTTSGGLSPKIRLYNPSGTLLSSASNNYPDGACAGGSTVEMNTITLPASGTYTVLIGDCSDTNTGDYLIYAQRTNSPFGFAPLLFGGQTQTGDVASAAQSNTLTFSGSTNNVADFTVVTTSGSLSPKIRLYNPAGSLIASASNTYPDGACAGGSTIELNSVTLPLNGIYTVLVGDCSDTNAGAYNLSGLCFGSCPAMPAIAWATPKDIIHGAPLTTTQLDASSPVAGTLTYNPKAGTVLPVGPRNLTVTLTPNDAAEYSAAVDSVQLLVNSAVKATLSPTSLNFGKQAVNTTSAAKSVTLTNTGTATLDIGGIAVSDAFAISANTCGSKLSAGDQCKVSVTFTPKQPSAQAGALRFDDNVPDSPQTVALSGSGVEP
ncbi:MAG: choice-of-anchor D domain-containing protein [Bryobacteraceae bacterium]|jgi:hypothetical protein